MKNVQVMKADFQAVVVATLGDLKSAAITVERSKKMIEMLKPFANDDLIVEPVIAMTKEAMKNPAALFNGSIVRDGIIYPEMEDGKEVDAAFSQMVDYMEAADADQAATISAIGIWTAEVMMSKAA